jgi:hypothetical protein
MTAAPMTALTDSVENLRRWLAVGACLLALGAGYLTVDLNLVGAAGWLAAGLLALALRAKLAIYVKAAQRADDLLAQLSALLADDLDDAPTPTGRPE